jgi:hypothetical protein
MPQYAVVATHEASQCPGANRTMRDVYQKVVQEAQGLQQKRGVKLALGPVHLDPAHKILVVAEAASQDTLVDHLMESRLAAIQYLEVYRLTPMEQLLGGTPPEPLY